MPRADSPTPVASPAARGVVLMIACSLLFATMATFVGAAHARAPALSTLMMSAIRSGVNLVALVILARGDAKLLLGDGRRALWIRGVLGGVSLVSYFTALAHVGVGEAAFLNQTSAVWVAIFAPVFLGEPTGALVWLAVGCSLVGVSLLAAPVAGAPPGDAFGRAIGLFSGLTSAGAYLSVRRAGATNKPITIVFYFTLVAALGTTIGCVVRQESLPRDPVTLGLMVGAGLTATLAQLIMTEAYRVGRAGSVAAAGAAGPLFSTVLGAVFLRQVPDKHAALGMGILLVSAMGLPFLAARAADRGTRAA